MANELSILAVFLAGVASFLSPCVLPLMPVYLSYLTGEALEGDTAVSVRHRRRVVIQSLGFLLGFLAVNGLLGLTATGLGRFLAVHAAAFRQASGALLIVLGLFHLGVLKIPGLNRERKFRVRTGPPRFLNAVLIGILFSFGWTPCTGAILASVLVVAANGVTFWSGVGLLLIYSLGFGIPFLLAAVFLNVIVRPAGWSKPASTAIKWATGLLIVLAGVLIATGNLDRIILLFS